MEDLTASTPVSVPSGVPVTAPLLHAAEPLLRLAMRAAEDPATGYSVSSGAVDDFRQLRELCRVCMDASEPDEIMMRDGEPYAERWYIQRGRVNGSEGGLHLYLHRFLDDDDPVLHDHPWASASWVIEGEIAETWASNGAASSRAVKILSPGDLIVRSAVHAHCLAVQGKERPVTIFATADKTREWGFWPEGKFVHWQNYQGERNAKT